MLGCDVCDARILEGTEIWLVKAKCSAGHPRQSRHCPDPSVTYQHANQPSVCITLTFTYTKEYVRGRGSAKSVNHQSQSQLIIPPTQHPTILQLFAPPATRINSTHPTESPVASYLKLDPPIPPPNSPGRPALRERDWAQGQYS